MSGIKSLAYDNILKQLNTEAFIHIYNTAEMSDLSFLWKLRKTRV